jgi:REP element-mobilizing transposase RayT
MARQARIIIPGCAHYVIHRARPGVPLFRNDRDYARYRALLAEKAAMHAVAVNTASLGPDHVELLLTPQTREGLARTVGETHRLYARHRDLSANALWAGRFQSCPVAPALAAASMEDIRPLLLAAACRGRPVGDPDFIARVESETGRNFTPRRRGRRPKW